jgi:hypothetical protein
MLHARAAIWACSVQERLATCLDQYLHNLGFSDCVCDVKIQSRRLEDSDASTAARKHAARAIYASTRPSKWARAGGPGLQLGLGVAAVVRVVAGQEGAVHLEAA